MNECGKPARSTLRQALEGGHSGNRGANGEPADTYLIRLDYDFTSIS